MEVLPEDGRRRFTCASDWHSSRELPVARDTPDGQQKMFKEMPIIGLLLGCLAGSLVTWVTLNDVLESEIVLQFSFLRQIAYLIPMLVGGCIGGIIHLRKQGRTAEIARFLHVFLGAALWVVFFFGSMYLGAWLGERLFGSVEYWIGWFTGAVLFVVVQSRFPRRSSSEKPPVPPPA
jgi:hypothetical protein